MERRNFLTLLGLAPFAGLFKRLLKQTPKRYWEGTTIPRSEDNPSGYQYHYYYITKEGTPVSIHSMENIDG